MRNPTPNKKRRKSFVSRFTSICLVAILQITLLIVPYFFLADYAKYLYIVTDIISFGLCFFIMGKKIPASFKMPWVVLLLAVPVFGWVLYVIYGLPHGSKKEQLRKQSIIERRNHLTQCSSTSHEQMAAEFPEATLHGEYLRRFAGSAIYSDTDTRFFSLGDDAWPAMLEDLRKAEQYIYMEFFIVQSGDFLDSILDILKEKAQQGVEVRFVYDSFGSLTKVYDGFARELCKAGVDCVEFNPFKIVFDINYNNRDHRKICVIDGRVAYTGGINLADEYVNRIELFGHWKDTAIRLEGAAVYGMLLQFLAMWEQVKKKDAKMEDYEISPRLSELKPAAVSRGYVSPYTDYPGDNESVGENVYLNIITHAKRYVYIMTPYLIIDSTMKNTLENAAKSGVDVRIITPGIPDKKTVFIMTRSFYEPLLRAGVKIYEYTPGFVHAKISVADDCYATVGTINLDYRSLVHHYENGVWLCGTDSIKDIHQDFLNTQAMCHEVTLEDCRKYARGKQLILPILNLFAPLM